MRILSITPMHVGEAEIARRQARYDRLAPVGFAITLVDLPAGPTTPVALNTGADIRASERLVVAAALAADPTAFDAILPDCVLDPGVPELDERSPLPVLGITRLTAGLLASLGTPFGAVTRNEAIGAELTAVIGRYGLAHAFAGVEVLGLSVADITNEVLWNAAASTAAARLASHGATAIVNGCSAVEVTDAATGTALVDPTALALELAALAASRGALSTVVRPAVRSAARS